MRVRIFLTYLLVATSTIVSVAAAPTSSAATACTASQVTVTIAASTTTPIKSSSVTFTATVAVKSGQSCTLSPYTGSGYYYVYFYTNSSNSTSGGSTITCTSPSGSKQASPSPYTTFTCSTNANSSSGNTTYYYARYRTGSGTGSSTNAYSSTLAVQTQSGVSTTSLSTGLSPQTTTVGTPVTLTATVTSGATGTVTFAAGGSSSTLSNCGTSGAVTISGSSASCTWTPTAASSGVSITASYGGNGSYGTSSASPISVAVTQKTTSIVLNSPPASSAKSTLNNLSATITPAGAVGTVTFKQTVAGSETTISGCSGKAITSGVATCAWTTDNATESATLIAYFVPTTSANYSSSQTAGAVVSVGAFTGTTTALTADIGSTPKTITLGASIVFTATASRASGNVAFSNTSYFEFYYGNTKITSCGTAGQVTISGSSASCTWTPLTAITGGINVTAVYSGDTSTFSQSTSSAYAVTVSKANTTALLTTSDLGSPKVSAVNNPVTLTATVSRTTGTAALDAAGYVIFKVGGTAITNTTSTCGDSSGHVLIDVSTNTTSCIWTPIAISSGVLTATYYNDANYNDSPASPSVALTVGKGTGTLVIASSDADTSLTASAVTLTATLTNIPADLAGTVSFQLPGSDTCASGFDGAITGPGSITCEWSPSASKLSGASITATFTPTSGTNWNTTTSGATSVIVHAVPVVSGSSTIGATTGTAKTTSAYTVADSSNGLTITWSLTSAPAGVSIDATTGVISISSSPTGGSFSVVATDSNSVASIGKSVTLTVSNLLTITTPSGSGLNGNATSTFSTLTISSSGGAGTNVFTLASDSSALPSGLTLNSSGTLTGTPTTAGSYTGIKVKVTDANGAIATTSAFTLTIASAVLIDSPSGSNAATVGSTFSLTVTSTGGAGSNVFTLATGSTALPAGVILKSDGTITGTPTTAGTTAGIKVTVTDALSVTSTTSLFAIVVAKATLSTPTSVSASATSGSTTSITVTFSGDSHATSFTAKVYAGGSLTKTVTSFTSTSAITGLTAATAYTVGITAIGGSNYSDSAESSKGPVTTGSSSLAPTIATNPAGASKTAGQSLSLSVTASSNDSGDLTYQWRKGGSNISGATDSTLVITSLVTGDAGTYTVVVTNTKNGTTATATSTGAILTVSTALSITTPTGSGVSSSYLSTYSLTISASGGSGTKTFALTSGTLPAWATLSSSGVITGTANVVGTTTGLVVTVTDANSATSATSAFNITIGKADPVIAWDTPSPIRLGAHLTSTEMDASASFGGSALAGAFVYTPDASTTLSSGTVSLSAVFTPTDGTHYNTITTANSIVVLSATGPSAPAKPTLTATGAAAGSLILTWVRITGSPDNGGSAVTGYQYRLQRTDSESWGDWSSTQAESATTATISGLTKNKAYIVQVRAINAIHEGSISLSSSTATVAGIAASTPNAPQNVVVKTDDGKLIIDFDLPSGSTEGDGGDADARITAYQYSLDGVSTWKSTGSTSREITVSSLVNGTTYDVRVRAVNSVGTGAASATFTGTAKPNKAPGKPTIVSATVGAGTLTVSFNPPADNGGGTLTYTYRLKTSNDGENGWGDWKSTGSLTSTDTGFSYVIAGITNGSTYNLQMKSTNEFGRASGVTDTFTKSSSKASKPTITSQPVAQSLTATQTSAFTVSVTATTGAGETLSYQWYKDSSAIDGATSATYSISRALVVGDAGDYYVIVTSTINGTSDTRQSNTVHQNVVAKLTVGTTAPGATANSDYSKVLSVTNGAEPFTWTGSSLPTGLTLDSNGTVHGKVTTANTYTFSATATDKNGVSNTATVSLVVSPALLIVTTTLDATSVDKSYSGTFTASGGNSSTYVWAVTGDVSLPTGLTLSSSGAISGTTGHTATSKTFSITVTDANGATTSSKFTIAVVSGVAGAPTLNPTITKPASGQLSISWTAPSDIGGSTITEYAIKYVSSSSGDSEDKGTKSVKVSDLGGSPFSATISELKNGREYTISISAKNSGGYGTSSLSYSATPGVIPGKPQSVTTTLDGAGMVLRWKKPDGDGFGDLTYSAQCKKDSGSYSSVNISDASSGDEGRLSKSITGLVAGSHYVCQVKSTSAYGSSDWSLDTSDLTYMTKPGTPQSISGSSTGDGSVSVSWQAPASNGGGQITSDIASTNKNGGEDSEGNRSCSIARATASDAGDWDDAGYTFTCKIEGMPKKGTFKVYLVAVNAVGSSTKSSGTEVTIAGKTQTLTIPDAAKTTINKKVGDADFSIGATVTSGLKVGYTSDNPSSCLVTSARMIRPLASGDCVITISQNGKKDDNSNGEDSEYGQISGANTVNVHVTAATPGAPIITSVSVGDASITLIWKPNTGVGSAPTGYNFQFGDTATSVTWSASTPITNGTSSVTYSLTGLTNGTGYEVRVQAVNGALLSDWTVAVGPYIPAGVPDAPAAPTVSLVDSTGTATISWGAPAGNGGSPIKGYKVTSTRTGSTSTCTTGFVSLTCNIGGLANKFGYSFTVQAQNSSVTNGGWGAASSATSGTLNGLAQVIIFDTSTAITGWTVGDADVQLKAKTDSGLAIAFGSTDSTICSVSGTGSVHFKTSGNCQITMDQLGTETNYSAATQVRALLVIDPATPSAPLISSVTNVTSGLTVVWTAPARLGGALTYLVTALPTMDSSTAVTCAPIAPAMTCTLLGDGGSLTKGVEYSITVVAHNNAGDGPASGARIGKWQTKPTVPNSATAVKDSTDGRAINVGWAKSSDDGTSAILRYVATATPTDGSLTSKTCQVTPSGALDISGYTCVITALRAGATYNIAIVAVNAIDTSPSAPVTGVVPGLTQTITVTTPIAKVLGAGDFALDASSTSGKPLTYSTSDSTCTLPSAGIVHLASVGTCTIHIDQLGSTSSDEFAYSPAARVDVVVNISATTPDSPSIIKAVPGVGKITVTWTAPTFNGGAATTTQAQAYLAGTKIGTCDTSGCDITTGLVNGTTYTVRIEAHNSIGSTFSTSLTARPYDALPNAPVPLVAQGGLARVDLSWTAPSNVDALGVGHSIHHYQVEGRVAPSNPADAWPGTAELLYNPVDTNTATTTSFTGLAPGKTYEFRARAVGVDGGTTTYSEYTGSSYANTFGVPVFTGATLSLTPGFSAGHATNTVSWPVPSSNGGSSVTGFTATATNGGTSISCSGGANATTCTILGLTSGLSYSVSLVATNAVGNSLPLTGSLTTVGAPTVAPVITGVTSSVDTGTATISWTGIPVSGNGGKVVTSYTVNAYKDGSGTSSASCSAVSTDTDSTPGSYSCTITGLTYKSNYVFKAVATNIAGDGLLSDPTTPAVYLVLPQTISFANPYSPSTVNFTVGSVVLSATSTSGGAIIFTTGSSACSVSASTVTFLGLGTCAIVANQNGVGTNFSAADPVTQTFTIQAIAPESVSLLQVEPGASTLKATWSVITVAQLGGSIFKHYVISWAKKTDFSDETTAIVSSRTTDYFQITGLDALATYRVRVQVITEDWADGSAWSNVLTGTTFGLPSAPAIQPTPTSAAPGSATITWTDSADDGGTPITGYLAKAYDATTDALTGQTCAASSSTCVISGLSGAISYKFRVFASNAVGSASSGLTTTALRPGSSQTLTVANVSKLHTDANFTADGSSSSGLPVQFSKVPSPDVLFDSYTATTWASGRTVCSVDSTTGAVTIDLAGTCTIAADQNGNDAVVGGNSTTYLAAPQKTFTVTVAATLPGVIRVPSATSDNSRLRIQWSAPAPGADGGVHITGYQIMWWNQTDHPSRPSDADFANFDVSATGTWHGFGRMMVNAANWYDFYLENLHNGDTYTILIQAQNSVGLGPESL